MTLLSDESGPFHPAPNEMTLAVGDDVKAIVARDIYNDLEARFIYWSAEDAAEVTAKAVTAFLVEALGGYGPSAQSIQDAFASHVGNGGTIRSYEDG